MIDQRGALLDERDFVAAKDAQLGDDRILCGQGTPAMSIEPQGVGLRLGVVPVGLVAAGLLALTVAFGAFRVDGINGDTAVEELFDGGTEAGFDGDPEVGEGGVVCFRIESSSLESSPMILPFFIFPVTNDC